MFSGSSLVPTRQSPRRSGSIEIVAAIVSPGSASPPAGLIEVIEAYATSARGITSPTTVTKRNSRLDALTARLKLGRQDTD
jgi:hypothetical protein